MKNLLNSWNRLSLVKQIIIGLVIGIILALTVPEYVSGITIFGDLFVGALKSVAPVLVLFLVILGFVTHDITHIQTCVCAMAGASILLLFEKPYSVRDLQISDISSAEKVS